MKWMLAIAVAGAWFTTGAFAATPPLPADVVRLIDRIESCAHFAGEFNGDRSERDREVNRAMRELRCDRIETRARTMRRRYPTDARVQHALDAAAEL